MIRGAEAKSFIRDMLSYHPDVDRSGAVVRPGQRVRLVQMNGCMADVRGRVDEGTVEALEMKTVYGDSTERPYARILFDDGRVEDRCAEVHCWYPNETDGVMEYRY